jgi:cellulose synthase/poly-beta-1,6-N-acetylglucosamine synthase-like glycosyltransferase
MGLVFVSVMLAYSAALLFLTRKWGRLHVASLQETTNYRKITIIVPVRNEAENILILLDAIQAQGYPRASFEVIIVDDQSVDTTYDLVQEFRDRSPISIQILRSNPVKGSPKKQAIELAVESSTGEIILTTDGDCEVEPGWLKSINQAFTNANTRLVMGPVAYQVDSFMDRLQWVEFSALQGVSAVLLNLGIPAMGNGANLAYRKSAFLEVSGFDGNRDIASGDDEFLVRKVATKYGVRSINYMKSTDTIVSTQPAQGWTEIVNQKVRWSSKWKHQRGFASWLLPMLVLALNLWPLLGFLAYSYSMIALSALVLGWGLKGLADMVFAQSIAAFMGQKHRWIDLILGEIIYPFYVLFFGIASIFGRYGWKGRKYNE